MTSWNSKLYMAMKPNCPTTAEVHIKSMMEDAILVDPHFAGRLARWDPDLAQTDYKELIENITQWE